MLLADDELVFFNGTEAGLGAVGLLEPCFEHEQPISNNIGKIKYIKVVREKGKDIR